MFNDKYGLTKAVLEGRKMQTRRLVPKELFTLQWDVDEDEDTLVFENDMGDFIDIRKSSFAHYKVGEVVAIAKSYKDCTEECIKTTGFEVKTKPYLVKSPGYKNKMFVRADLMPHHIRITDIRVEKLNDISKEDCLAEGIYPYYYYGDQIENQRHGIPPNGYSFDGIGCFYQTPRVAYASLIDKVSGKGTWDSNPFVFVYEFELVD